MNKVLKPIFAYNARLFRSMDIKKKTGIIFNEDSPGSLYMYLFNIKRCAAKIYYCYTRDDREDVTNARVRYTRTHLFPFQQSANYTNNVVVVILFYGREPRGGAPDASKLRRTYARVVNFHLAEPTFR